MEAVLTLCELDGGALADVVLGNFWTLEFILRYGTWILAPAAEDFDIVERFFLAA